MSAARPRHSALRHALHRFARDETGTATIEFVILFPIFMVVFLSTLEGGFLQVRQVMLDRATDLSVRELRLGLEASPTHEKLRDRICEYATVIPDCRNSLVVELTRVSKDDWTAGTSGVRCVDKEEDVAPVTAFVPGGQHDMMLLRVCAVVRPIFPTTGLGLALQRQTEDYYALVARAAFVNEPRS
ncbi:TadE/TadG family type IV pilus assembly protein [Tropicimonas sp. IMCC34011]|uniref:TadE/TadG family type IV pilus assembly protein n=1 Tax=Tropicimonas sp. IMCC34011 TaxID=2248759 RepID=UPI000E23F439|nr:TadE/TadG family type IV pilus assembly protein [Tropicimonas sp. IMCC34011]